MQHGLRSFLAPLLVFVLAACGTSTTTNLPPPPPPPPPGGGMTAQELMLANDCLTAINNYRATLGLPPFAFYTNGANVAYAHCVDMATNGFFDHNSPTTGTPAQRAMAAGITHQVPGCLEPGTLLPCQGENLATGLNANLTGLEVTNGWIASPGHHAQLVAPNMAPGVGFAWPAWTHCGIGVRRIDNAGNISIWWTAMFFRNPTP
jgi:uncharacterized protein YkwD